MQWAGLGGLFKGSWKASWRRCHSEGRIGRAQRAEGSSYIKAQGWGDGAGNLGVFLEEPWEDLNGAVWVSKQDSPRSACCGWPRLTRTRRVDPEG